MKKESINSPSNFSFAIATIFLVSVDTDTITVSPLFPRQSQGNICFIVAFGYNNMNNSTIISIEEHNINLS